MEKSVLWRDFNCVHDDTACKFRSGNCQPAGHTLGLAVEIDRVAPNPLRPRAEITSHFGRRWRARRGVAPRLCSPAIRRFGASCSASRDRRPKCEVISARRLKIDKRAASLADVLRTRMLLRLNTEVYWTRFKLPYIEASRYPGLLCWVPSP
jgi:hypothetical protein